MRTSRLELGGEGASHHPLEKGAPTETALADLHNKQTRECGQSTVLKLGARPVEIWQADAVGSEEGRPAHDRQR